MEVCPGSSQEVLLCAFSISISTGVRIGSTLMGIKACSCYDEHWVLYVSVESLNCTSETNTVC